LERGVRRGHKGSWAIQKRSQNVTATARHGKEAGEKAAMLKEVS